MSTVQCIYHVVFRTKGSRCTIPEQSKRTLLAYLYSVSMDMGVKKVFRLNCYLNHVHILVDLPPNMNIAEYVQKIKGISSRTFKGHPDFPDFDGWARRYGALSKSHEHIMTIVNYIKNQEEHHRLLSFKEELEQIFGADFFKDSFNRRDWLDESVDEI